MIQKPIFRRVLALTGLREKSSMCFLGIFCLLLLFTAIHPVRASAPAAPQNQQISLPLIIKQSAFPVIANGDFEDAPNRAWAESSSNGAALIVDFSLLPNSVQTRSGLYLAWLGGLPDEASVLAQVVSIPPGEDALKLRYWYWIASEEVNCSDDLAVVQLRNAATGAEATVGAHSLCRTTATDGWTRACVDVSGRGGQSTIFQFVTVLDGSRNSNFFVDDVSLASSCVGET